MAINMKEPSPARKIPRIIIKMHTDNVSFLLLQIKMNIIPIIAGLSRLKNCIKGSTIEGAEYIGDPIFPTPHTIVTNICHIIKK